MHNLFKISGVIIFGLSVVMLFAGLGSHDPLAAVPISAVGIVNGLALMALGEVVQYTKNMKEKVNTGLPNIRKYFDAEGAVAIGPYSHSVQTGKLLYLSGQTPIDSNTGLLVEGDIGAQTKQCFENLFNVLDAAGLSSDNVIKVNVYLTNMENFTGMNNVYKEQFSEPYPSRTTIGVAELPLGAKVEIEMIAEKK